MSHRIYLNIKSWWNLCVGNAVCAMLWDILINYLKNNKLKTIFFEI